jgi:hypothetical protein
MRLLSELRVFWTGWLAGTYDAERRSLGTRWSTVVSDFTYSERRSLRSLFTPWLIAVWEENVRRLGGDFVHWMDLPSRSGDPEEVAAGG